MKHYAPWPALPAIAEWQNAHDTLHMWTQIVGKIRLELSPWQNHSWGSTLYVAPRGLTTSPIPYGNEAFDITFDFVEHRLVVTTSRDEAHSFPLEPMTVATFHRRLFELLTSLGIEVQIYNRPVEVVEAIPFHEDETHASYDADVTGRLHEALLRIDAVFKQFRAGFIGKASPSHFFWGAFDLAVTRFSGRAAPPHPGGAPNCADWVMREAYSHELASAGFWTGTGYGEPAFYAYAYPEPEGYSKATVRPAAAFYSDTMREYVLPYKAVRDAADPAADLLQFLESTYGHAADLGHWDRDALENASLPEKR